MNLKPARNLVVELPEGSRRSFDAWCVEKAPRFGFASGRAFTETMTPDPAEPNRIRWPFDSDAVDALAAEHGEGSPAYRDGLTKLLLDVIGRSLIDPDADSDVAWWGTEEPWRRN